MVQVGTKHFQQGGAAGTAGWLYTYSSSLSRVNDLALFGEEEFIALGEFLPLTSDPAMVDR